MGLIYIIKNNCNNKVYVGQTSTSMEHRWKDHIKSAKGNFEPSMILYKAMRKYGIENFYVELVEDSITGTDALNDREKYWIEQYDSLLPNGYNVREGGEDCGRREVYKINSATNEIIKRYDSLTQAAEENNIDLSHLSKVCQGKERSCGGYKWCYVDSYDEAHVKNIKTKANKRAIYQIDNMTGEILQEFESITKASRLTNSNQPSISMCLNGKNKTANGYNWCYVDEYDKNSFVLRSRCQKVLQIDKDTDEVINVWSSAKEAANNIGKNGSTIRAACSGKRKTAYGYKWKYL